MPDPASVRDKIKELIVTTFKFEVPVEDIDDDMQIVNGGLFLDSVASMQLILLLEEEYSISFGHEELSFDNINSIAHMAAYILQRLKREPETGREINV